MELIELEATMRKELKKEACKRYRRAGAIPCIIYGQGKNVNIRLDSRKFIKLYPRLTKSTVINLKLDKNQYEVLIKDYEKDYIKDKFIHIDFYELKKGKPVHSFIPLNLIGNAIGIREGGILEKHLVELEIECLPKDIVSHLDVNIENMKINDTLHVRDLKIDKKHKMLSHIDEVIVHITGKIAEEVELAEVTEEAVEEAEEKVVDEETKTEK